MNDPPIPAATLILVRDGGEGAPQILMVERAAGMAFAGGALVFPGGRIDEADRQLSAALGLTDEGAAIAAIRETVEETAVPAGLAPTPSADLTRDLQYRLVGGAAFADVLTGAELRMDVNALVPFARWVPKFHAVRRFDTLFFLAAAPPGEWEPRAMAGESSAAFWLSAAEVLERDRAGAAKLIFPTRRTLERLARHGSFADMLADARTHSVEPITPWVEERNGERFVTIPDHLGFPVTQERLEGLWRG